MPAILFSNSTNAVIGTIKVLLNNEYRTAKSWAWDKDAHTNNIKLGGYGLLNLSTSYNFTDNLIVYLNRKNVLDKDYEMARGYKSLGKTTTLGLTYTF